MKGKLGLSIGLASPACGEKASSNKVNCVSFETLLAGHYFYAALFFFLPAAPQFSTTNFNRICDE